MLYNLTISWNLFVTFIEVEEKHYTNKFMRLHLYNVLHVGKEIIELLLLCIFIVRSKFYPMVLGFNLWVEIFRTMISMWETNIKELIPIFLFLFRTLGHLLSLYIFFVLASLFKQVLFYDICSLNAWPIARCMLPSYLVVGFFKKWAF